MEIIVLLMIIAFVLGQWFIGLLLLLLLIGIGIASDRKERRERKILKETRQILEKYGL